MNFLELFSGGTTKFRGFIYEYFEKINIISSNFLLPVGSADPPIYRVGSPLHSTYRIEAKVELSLMRGLMRGLDLS